MSVAQNLIVHIDFKLCICTFLSVIFAHMIIWGVPEKLNSLHKVICLGLGSVFGREA